MFDNDPDIHLRSLGKHIQVSARHCVIPELDLVGQFYNCIFDEAKGEYNKTKPHKHEVWMAWKLCDPGSIHNGICYKGKDGNMISGCNISNFTNGQQ